MPLFERVLPRHMQIIYEINGRFLQKVQARKDDTATLSKVSLIDENGERRVRMGNLAFVGSHKVNGVAALHTELMKQTVFADLHSSFPDRINNKTNGITPRRWLHQSNTPLSDLITEPDRCRLDQRPGRVGGAEAACRRGSLPRGIPPGQAAEQGAAGGPDRARTEVESISVDSMFDVQVKRIHEYKRQLLNVLQTIALYNDMRDSQRVDWVPVTKIFAGKAAPAYHMAKLTLKLINDVAKVVNQDPPCAGC